MADIHHPLHALITGGGGFLATHLARLLAEGDLFRTVTLLIRSAQPCTLIRVSSLAAQPRPGGSVVRVVFGDVACARTMMSLFGATPITHVYHLSAVTHVDRALRRPDKVVASNVRATQNLLKVCTAAYSGGAGVRIVHVTTQESWQCRTGGLADLTNPYALSKYTSDRILLEGGRAGRPEVACVYCPNIFGALQHVEKFIPRMIHAALLGVSMPIFGQGTQTRAWVDVNYVADLLARLATGELGAPHHIIQSEDIHRNIDLAGRIGRTVQKLTGTPFSFDFREGRKGDQSRGLLSECDQAVVWRPPSTLLASLGDLVDWYATHASWMAACTGEHDFPVATPVGG